jgi:hypothetical protein
LSVFILVIPDGVTSRSSSSCDSYSSSPESRSTCCGSGTTSCWCLRRRDCIHLNMTVTSPPPQLDYSRSRPSLSLAASIGSRSSSKNLGGEAGGCAKFARRPRVALTNAWSPDNPHGAGLQAARGYPSRAQSMHVRTHQSLTTCLVIPHGNTDCAATSCWTGGRSRTCRACGKGRLPRDPERPKPRATRPACLRAGSQPALEVPRQATLQASAGRRASARARVPTSSPGRHHQRAPRHDPVVCATRQGADVVEPVVNQVRMPAQDPASPSAGREPPSDAEIEAGSRERAVSDPRAAEILLRWLQRPPAPCSIATTSSDPRGSRRQRGRPRRHRPP